MHCKTCGFADPQQTVCQLKRSAIDPNDKACNEYNRSPEHCQLCGIPLHPTYTIVDLSNDLVICANCDAKIGLCPTCENAKICPFETDPSPLPKIVQKVIRQGNMTTVSQVKNPDRIAITCVKNCLCYDPKIGCLKEIGFCNGYHCLKIYK